jgi:hypothetical protein
MKMIGQHDNGIDRKWMPASGVAKGRAQNINMIAQQP